MKLPALSFNLNMPPRVAAASAVILVAAILLAVLMPLLGGNRDSAVILNEQLTGEIAKLRTEIQNSQNDYQYVQDNQAKYEELLKGGRLIPHTRRSAVRHMQELALTHGITAMAYSFSSAGQNSAEAALNQPATAAYSVSVEVIELKLGAPLDSRIFRFVSDAAASFPGSAVVQSLSLGRANTITTEALNKVSRGEDSGLVSGTAMLLWRTALKNKEEGAQSQ